MAREYQSQLRRMDGRAASVVLGPWRPYRPTAVKRLRSIMNREEALSIARTAAEGAYELLAHGSLRDSEEPTVTGAMLGASIVDGFHAVISLATSPGQAYASTIVRSMIEALGDLCHLAADVNYLDRLRLTSAIAVQRSSEEFIADHVNDQDVADIVELAKTRCREAKTTISALKGRANTLTVAERVNAPGLSSAAARIYGLECFDAHQDLTALMRRHLDGDAIKCGGTLNDAELIGTLTNAVAVLAIAVEVLPTFVAFDPTKHAAKAELICGCAASLTEGRARATEPHRAHLRSSSFDQDEGNSSSA